MNNPDIDAFLNELRARAAAAAADEPLPENAYVPEAEDGDFEEQMVFYREHAEAALAEQQLAQERLVAAEANPELAPAEVNGIRRSYEFIRRSAEELGLALADVYLAHRGFFALAPNIEQAIHHDLGAYAVYAIRLLLEEDEEDEEALG